MRPLLVIALAGCAVESLVYWSDTPSTTGTQGFRLVVPLAEPIASTDIAIIESSTSLVIDTHTLAIPLSVVASTLASDLWPLAVDACSESVANAVALAVPGTSGSALHAACERGAAALEEEARARMASIPGAVTLELAGSARMRDGAIIDGTWAGTVTTPQVDRAPLVDGRFE